LGFGANSETNYTGSKRQWDNESFHVTPLV
jgi:hypothetical protein